jgi:hypothetical protein
VYAAQSLDEKRVLFLEVHNRETYPACDFSVLDAVF